MGMIEKIFGFPEKKKVSTPEPASEAANEKKLSEEEINEKYFVFYLDKYLQSEYPSMAGWKFAAENKLWHYEKIFVMVQIQFPTGESSLIKIETYKIYKFRAAEQHMKLPAPCETDSEPAQELRSPALIWYEAHIDELAAAKAAAQVNEQVRFSFKVEGLDEEQILQLIELYIEKTGYCVERGDTPDTIFVTFE